MRAAIQAIRSHVPDRKLTNEDLAQEFGDWTVQKIFEKTGINVRYVAAPEECASDLGVAAAQKLFADGLLAPDAVDFLIFCTQSPDYFLPASACVMQSRLGLRTSCGALDINQGCSGFVYGLSLANGLIESGAARNVVLVTADTYSKYIDANDRSVRTIFGDGAAATWVGPIESLVESDPAPIGPFVFGTDGRGADQLIVRAGAARMPSSEETTAQHLYMNGPEIFTFTLRQVPGLVQELLSKAGQSLDDVDLVVFHQASLFMLEQLRRKLKIPREKFSINLENAGNTVSATIPMALEAALGRGELKPGAKVLIAGFGVGYSWAAAMLRWL